MIDYAKVLNPAQYDAATFKDGSALVIAGAGSGKTRVIAHRLAWLLENGASPESILLLTFTRKAAQEMLNRASLLLGQSTAGISGGTFHSFAYSALRRYAPLWLGGRPFTLLDSQDINQIIRQCKEQLKIGKKDTSFPKTQTIASILSKARNKELDVGEVLRRDRFHLLPHAEAIAEIGAAYQAFRQEKGLLDYDDLLFELEALLQTDSHPARVLRDSLKHILVDEYQDTNLVQARITRLLAGPPVKAGEKPLLTAQVMAVGDEAQSIYAFRGANVRNILEFPKLFPDSRLIRLEENYRSTQPVLDVANSILAHASQSFHKHLFTQKSGGEKPRLIRPLTDASQAQLVTQRIQELLSANLPHEIAVLFRAGFHSYPLENALRQAGISFRKYGGLRLIEAAHIKDVLSFARLALNPLDLPAFSRVAGMHKGVGPKTIAMLHDQMTRNDVAALRKSLTKRPELLNDLVFIDNLRLQSLAPGAFMEKLLDYYKPRLETHYPEDWPARMQGLEEILQIAWGYNELDMFVADLALESPEDDKTEHAENCVTLSTVHSAKGLEWKHVLIIDLVEDRFPSRHALSREEDYEEERRLFYVACTRAKQGLELYAPATVYSRSDNASVAAVPSPFVRELAPGCVEFFIETYQGHLAPDQKRSTVKKPEPVFKTPQAAPVLKAVSGETGYCRHKIFGRGKILKRIDEEKVQVNFPGFGPKIILADYLQMEE